MKGSPKVILQEKGSTRGTGTSPYKSSPTFKGRHSVKVKYGLDDDSELASTSSPSPSAQPSRKFSANTPHLGKVSNTPNLKPKSKPSPTSATGSTRGMSNKTSTQASSTSIMQQRNQQSLPRKGKCEICHQLCTSHCAGCKRVFYCSKQHQQKDWSKHKLVCRPFSIPTQHSSKSHICPSGGGPSSSSSSFNSSSNNNDQSFSGVDVPATNMSQEHQFMVSTKQIAAGSLLFTEQPLLVAANVFGPLCKGDGSIWCCSCLKVISNPSDSLNNNNSKATEKADSCPICQVPLCQECLRHIGRSNTAGPPNNFYAGQGHSAEECALISDLCQKSPEVMGFINSCNDCKCVADLMKDLSILRVLMLRTTSLWRWESLITLKNSPRYQACCRHNLGNLEGWLGSTQGYPVSTYYLKNICKEKNFQLMDIVKIVAVFCEVSVRNTSLLVLYENLSWLAHACTPNAEQFFRQTKPSPQEESNGQANDLDILVKAVNKIDEHSKITVNYLTNFEGGRSALALRLFQTKGHYCCDANCACYQPRTFDKTLGIRCDIIFNTHACSGILSPRLDAPNPEKSNLGLGMFVKSKKWECDKCKKSEKYESLHKRIMEIAQDLTGACDRCCNSSCSAGGFGKGQQPPFLQLQSKLLYHLSDEHWMLWKAKLRILKSWTASTGYGPAVVRSFLSSESSSLQEAQRTGLIYVLKQKVEIYGDGIYASDTKVKSKMGVLELLAKRHGRLSPKRGHLLFDAFYANLLVLVEDYKKELPLPPGHSDLKRGQVSREYCKKIVILRNLMEQAVESLQVAEGTTLSSSSVKSFRIAKESLEVITKVCSKVEQRPNLIISYLNDFLELYACQDPNFISSRVRKSQSKSDPFRHGLVEDDCLDFEVDSLNLGTGASFTFGAATSGTSSQGVRKSWIGSNYTFGAGGTTSTNPFGFSGFGSPSFGLSDLESDIDDDEDNPFVYSKTSKAKSTPKSNDKESPRASRNKSGSKSKAKGDTDWSSYFWFSSDDDDDNDNPLDDDFDLGFPSSPRSTFGGDLFNDQELDDLAEWAALQFMMGKMKL